MIVTKYFVYIHTSRHAGTFLNKLILENIEGASMIQYHGHLRNLPEVHSSLPVIGFVRNPWDWYVSMYHDYRKKKQYLYEIVANAGDNDFESVVKRYLTLGDLGSESKKLREKLMLAAPQKITRDTDSKFANPGLEENDIRAIKPNTGYYTWLFQTMYKTKKKPKIFIGKFHNLRSDMLKIMKKTGVPINHEIEDYLTLQEPANQSPRHDDYRSYYSESLKNLVAKKDEFIIDKFDFSF